MVNVVINGVTYSYPQTGDQQWGDSATNAFVALAGSTLQKTGGNFTLTADVNFGGSFGVLAQYHSSRMANPSATGVFRLADTDAIGFRNHANSGDLLLSKNTSDQLLWNGNILATLTAGLLPVSQGGTGLASVAAHNLLTGNGTSALNVLAPGTSGLPLLSQGASADPAYAQLNLTSAVTGTLPASSGGTGVTSVTTTPTASAFAGWDASKNLSANNLVDGYTTTATAAGTTTLTVTSTGQQYFTGSTTQTVTLPVTSTLALGQQYIVTNLSSGIVTVQSSGGNTVQAMAASSQLLLTCISLSGTGTASWSWVYIPAIGGTLPIANGGTGQTTKAAAYDALSPNTTKGDIEIYSTTNARLGVGSDGQVLTADSTQTQGVKWATNPSAPDASDFYTNGSLSTSVASNALTIALKDKSGSDASAGSKVQIGFRNSTATTGTYNYRAVTSALSIVVPSGTTIGTANNVARYIFIYALDNAGTVELAVSLSNYWDEGQLQTTTAISGGSSATTLYSTTARTSVPIRLIGRLLISEATAGTWASAPTEVSPIPFLAGRQVAIGTAVGSSSTTTGTSYANLTNRINVTLVAQRTALYKIHALCPLSNNTASDVTTASIIATTGSPSVTFAQEAACNQGSGTNIVTCGEACTYAILLAGTSYTFDVQMKVNAGTGTFNAGAFVNGISVVAEET